MKPPPNVTGARSLLSKAFMGFANIFHMFARWQMSICQKTLLSELCCSVSSS
jgi:hypothetical protein